jgi:hypothetical protein
VLVSCGAPSVQGVGIVCVLAQEEHELRVEDVVVDDGALLPPCVAFALVDTPCAAERAGAKVPLLWIAALGLDSLWLSLTFSSQALSLSSSSPLSLSLVSPQSKVAVVRECPGLNLGAHASSCTGIT